MLILFAYNFVRLLLVCDGALHCSSPIRYCS